VTVPARRRYSYASAAVPGGRTTVANWNLWTGYNWPYAARAYVAPYFTGQWYIGADGFRYLQYFDPMRRIYYWVRG
jgi:hypothetical protein